MGLLRYLFWPLEVLALTLARALGEVREVREVAEVSEGSEVLGTSGSRRPNQ